MDAHWPASLACLIREERERERKRRGGEKGKGGRKGEMMGRREGGRGMAAPTVSSFTFY